MKNYFRTRFAAKGFAVISGESPFGIAGVEDEALVGSVFVLADVIRHTRAKGDVQDGTDTPSGRFRLRPMGSDGADDIFVLGFETGVGKGVDAVIATHPLEADVHYRVEELIVEDDGIDRSVRHRGLFVNGTLIRTASGRRPVETLKPGDMVWTLDNGFRPLRWMSRQSFALDGDSDPRPIRIPAGALAPELPYRATRMAPGAGIFLRSPMTERLIGEEEALAAAADLVALPGVGPDMDATRANYVQLMFDRHQIVEADGLFAETLHVDAESLAGMSPDAQAEITPLMASDGAGEIADMAEVRLRLTSGEARRVVRKHRRSEQFLCLQALIAEVVQMRPYVVSEVEGPAAKKVVNLR